MDQMNQTEIREIKIANGEVVKITEEEFQRAVDVFKILRDVDRRVLLEAVNGSKLDLKPVLPDSIKQYVGKNVFASLTVKEELQAKHWDFYYKLEKVKLESYSAKKKLATVRTIKNDPIEIEVRDIFAEVTK